ncbi:DUF645 family protein [Vibrio cholerae]|nr:DUF645 family protein [Vibrio cholerae]EGR0943203.1 DUF645 family protein [Vibrio cholerae]EGR1421603.1 DUF645 family protein [Vibrio cholerae]EHV2410557.1 DUF645 family protein [Vibrio cholerae]EHZ6902727.1 DUF645 family protein [Vibrio cholerae]
MIWLSLCGLLTFWQPTSQLLALDVCLRDAFCVKLLSRK